MLIAEKDPAESQNLLRALTELGFRNVTQANSAYKFLQYARVQKFSMIFVASSLGRAVETLGNLRAGSANVQTPAVFIHGPSEVSLAKAAAASGADATIQYPLEKPRVRKLLEDLFDMYIVTGPGSAEAVPQIPPRAAPHLPPLDAGQEFLEQGDLEAAREAFARALEEAGGSVEVYLGFAEACLAGGDREAGEKALKDAERLKPFVRREFRRRAPAFVRRGRQKLREGRHQEAILEYEGAILANPGSVGGYFGLGETLRAMGDEEGAERVFEQALKLDEEPLDLHLYNEMGLIARRKREFVTALFAFDRAISLAPDNAILYYNKAMVFVAQKNYGGALPLLQRAVSIEPEFVEAQQAENSVSHILSGLSETSAA
jgi:tetratricopeptide (TPR) repeat protein